MSEVYLVYDYDSQLLKIGSADDAEKRFLELSKNHKSIELLEFVEVQERGYYFERYLHECLSEYQAHYEWFSIPIDKAIKLGSHLGEIYRIARQTVFTQTARNRLFGLGITEYPIQVLPFIRNPIWICQKCNKVISSTHAEEHLKSGCNKFVRPKSYLPSRWTLGTWQFDYIPTQFLERIGA